MYVPNTEAEQQEMLRKIGLGSLDQLFDVIPNDIRLQRPLDLPPPLTEMELTAHLAGLARQNRSGDDKVCFLGGGCYDHFVPAVVDAIASRPEYYTAYTPYQAEASQGTLQVGFEYQTLLCELTGMEVANASLYEGGTAVVEGAMMAVGSAPQRKKIIVSDTVHPEYRATLATYMANLPPEIATLSHRDGATDLDKLRSVCDDSTACVIVQSPNFFGVVEPVDEVARHAAGCGATVVQAFDPISLGVLRRPADYGADIAVAEGQALGTPMSYGGPFLGLFACREKFVRKLPGRLVGETVDRKGRRAFTLTLQTREQHIRREKATSNICTNQGLLALRASVYLALMGPQGLKEVAELCWHKAHYAAKRLTEVAGVRVRFPGTFFKEFVVELPGPAERYLDRLVEAGFHGGVPLGRWYPDLTNCLLVAVTEKRSRGEIDAFADALQKVL